MLTRSAKKEVGTKKGLTTKQPLTAAVLRHGSSGCNYDQDDDSCGQGDDDVRDLLVG